MVLMNFFLTVLLQTPSTDPNRFNHFLILGYAAMWLIAVVYVASLANRQRNVREEIKLLLQLLRDDEEMSDR